MNHFTEAETVFHSNPSLIERARHWAIRKLGGYTEGIFEAELNGYEAGLYEGMWLGRTTAIYTCQAIVNKYRGRAHGAPRQVRYWDKCVAEITAEILKAEQRIKQ